MFTAIVAVLAVFAGYSAPVEKDPTQIEQESAQKAPAQTEQVLFQSGTDGYDCFRIPAITRTKQGTLLAFAEARNNVGDGDCEDDGDIDLVVRRSTDGGATWDPMITVASSEQTTWGNPVPIVVDGGANDGRIVLLTTQNPAGSSTPRTPHVQYSSFEQDGTEWTEPVSLADSIDRPDWGWYATGPGHGIQLQRGEHAGRLVAGYNASTGDDTNVAGVVYSDDGGTTWELGAIEPGASSSIIPQELSLLERTDGSIYAAARNNVKEATWHRAFGVSEDGGESLTAPFSFVEDLSTTPAVQGSTLRLRATDTGDSYNRMLMSTPVDTELRKNMTIYSSYDEGETWTDPVTITEDRAGYSDLVMVDDSTIGLLYEGGDYPDGDARDEIRFASFTEDDLGLPGGEPGPITSDESGNGLNAYVRGDASLGTGQFGQGIELDGTDDYVQLPYAESLAFGDGDFTVSGWMKYGETTGDQAIFWAYGQGTTTPQVWLRAEPESSRIRGLITTETGTASVSAAEAFDDNAWHHVALRRSGGQLALWVDGSQAGSTSAPTGTVSPNRPFTIFVGQRLDGSHRFDGALDELRLYPRALTESELDQIRTSNSAEVSGAIIRLPFNDLTP